MHSFKTTTSIPTKCGHQINDLLPDRVMTTRKVICLSAANLQKPMMLSRRRELTCASKRQRLDRAMQNPSVSIFLSRDQLLRVKELTISSGTHLNLLLAHADSKSRTKLPRASSTTVGSKSTSQHFHQHDAVLLEWFRKNCLKNSASVTASKQPSRSEAHVCRLQSR